MGFEDDLVAVRHLVITPMPLRTIWPQCAASPPRLALHVVTARWTHGRQMDMGMDMVTARSTCTCTCLVNENALANAHAHAHAYAHATCTCTCMQLQPGSHVYSLLTCTCHMLAGAPPQRHGRGGTPLRQARRAVDPHVLGHVDGSHGQAGQGHAITRCCARDGAWRARPWPWP